MDPLTFYLQCITPLMHISSCLILITYFHKSRNYLKVLFGAPLVLTFLFLLIKPYLFTIAELGSILSKIHIYSQGMPVVGFMHILFFLFVVILIGLGFLFYKKKMLHPILVTTMLFYGVTFLINPVVAHRLSPYLFFSLLLFPFDSIRYKRLVLAVDRLSILLFPVFFYYLFNTHRVESFKDFLIK